MKVTKSGKNNYYVGVHSHEIMEKNPFVDDLAEMQISTRTKVMAGNKQAINNMIVDKETGNVVGHQVLAVKQKVDSEQFTKVFRTGLAAMWGLTTSGVKVFSYIAETIKPNQDFVFFEIDEAKKYTGYKSQKSVLQGLGQLLDAGFIARTSKHYKYFINPTFFFNGNRLSLINHYVIDDTISSPDEERLESFQIEMKLPPSEK